MSKLWKELLCVPRGRLRRPRSQSLVPTLWFNLCSQIIVAKHELISMLLKSCPSKKSPKHESVNMIPLFALTIHRINFTLDAGTKNTGIIFYQYKTSVQKKNQYFFLYISTKKNVSFLFLAISGYLKIVWIYNIFTRKNLFSTNLNFFLNDKWS